MGQKQKTEKEKKREEKRGMNDGDNNSQATHGARKHAWRTHGAHKPPGPKSIIEEYQMQVIGGMMAAWELWEKALVPKLLSGAGTWVGPGGGKKAIDLCDNLQNFYWRVILKVPESCPKLALRCETRMLGMKWRVWQEKILLLLRRLPCRMVYEEGRAMGWPGLGMEVTRICDAVGLPDVNKVSVTKNAVKNAIFEHHYKEMLEELEGSKKLEAIKKDNFREVQHYFNDKSVERARMAYKVRCQMVPEIPGNFKSKYKKKGALNDEDPFCPHCQEDQVMTQSHCLECSAWEELREGLDMTDIKNMAMFFRKLLTERARLEALADV